MAEACSGSVGPGRRPHEELQLQNRYHALMGRVGPKKAAVAVAANLLRVVYHMPKEEDLGEAYRRPRNPARAAANLANRIRALGYQVDISRAA
jgi:hypothetical protein